jgi:hypothetical protein
MDSPLVIKHRLKLKGLGLEQRDLGRAAQITGSCVSAVAHSD